MTESWIESSKPFGTMVQPSEGCPLMNPGWQSHLSTCRARLYVRLPTVSGQTGLAGGQPFLFHGHLSFIFNPLGLAQPELTQMRSQEMKPKKMAAKTMLRIKQNVLFLKHLFLQPQG